MRGSIPPLPLCAFMALTGMNYVYMYETVRLWTIFILCVVASRSLLRDGSELYSAANVLQSGKCSSASFEHGLPFPR